MKKIQDLGPIQAGATDLQHSYGVGDIPHLIEAKTCDRAAIRRRQGSLLKLDCFPSFGQIGFKPGTVGMGLESKNHLSTGIAAGIRGKKF